MTVTLSIVAALLFVVANGFFVATEFAIARIRRTQVTELEAAGRPGASALRHAVDNLDAYLAACQLGITVSSIGLGIVAEPAFVVLLEPVFGPLGDWSHAVSFAFAFGLVTLLHVVFGELAPKSLAIARNTKTALAVAVPMRLFYLAAKPLVDFFNALGNLVLKPFGVPPAREVGHAPHSEDELRKLLLQSLEEGLIDPGEREFAENVFTFGDRRARQIMIPRPDVVFLTTDESARAAAERVIQTGHTRLPLCEPVGGLDAAVGLVNAKDLLGAILDREEGPALRELERPLKRVSESILIDELLRELQAERQHAALVLDEHGTAIGFVTLEDVLEEIVGEIDDEFDLEAKALVARGNGVLVVDGSAPIHLVADELETEISDPYEATIGGHVVEMLGRVPEVGEVVQIDGRSATIAAVEDARVVELVFELDWSPDP